VVVTLVSIIAGLFIWECKCKFFVFFFPGLEVLAVCFDKQLASEWHHVAKIIQQLASRGKGR
jgi:hypothetical protein